MVDVAHHSRIRSVVPVARCACFCAVLLIPALLTVNAQWSIYAALIWGIIGITLLVVNHWTALAVTVLRAAGPALGMACMLQNVIGRVTWPYNENATASMLLLLLPWWWGKNWFAVAIMVGGLVATGSAGAMLALSVAVALLIAKSYSGSRRPFWAMAMIIIGVSIVSGVILAALRPETTNARLAHWSVAWSLTKERPSFGFGPGTYPAVSAVADQNHADSLLLTSFVEMGMLGSSVLIVWMIETAFRVFETSGNPARMALLAWMLHNLVDCTLHFPLAAVLLAANVALLWRWHDTDTRNRTPGTPGGVGEVFRGAGAPE